MKITKGKQPAPRRIMLYGQHGVGKSSWAAAAPNPIFLDIEKGSGDIACERIEDLNSYHDVIAALEWLGSEPHSYATCVIDTVDWLEQLIFRDICSTAGVQSVADIDFGKGFPRAIPKWRTVLDRLDILRTQRKMGVILLAHARVEKFANPEGSTYDRYAPDLWTNARGEGAGNMIQEWCDEVLFACFEVYVKKEGKGFNEKSVATGGKERVIRTSESASSLAKNRLSLPEELPMNWQAYYDCVKRQLPAKPATTGVDISGIVVEGTSKPQFSESLLKEASEVF